MSDNIRKVWAEKTFELMNIGTGALTFGQAFSNHSFSLPIALLGIILLLIGYLISYLLLRRR